MPITFATNSYRLDSLKISQQRVVNGYAEIQPPDAKTQIPVFGSPGIRTLGTMGNGPVRGLTRLGSLVYGVSGDGFYQMDSTGTVTQRGSGITGSGVVSIAKSTVNEIAITNGSLGFLYNASTTNFDQITDANFQAAETNTFLDGYFIYDWLGTNKFFLSALLDGATYPSLSFAYAESQADNVLAVVNRKSALLLFGEDSVEVWDHTGASSFPFQKIKGATLDRGLAAAHATVAEDEAVFFLGNDLVFYRYDGNGVRRISTHAIEKAWQRYTTTTDAFCQVHIFGGHKFIVLTFPTEGTTWVTDIATNYLWHERASYDPTGMEVRWRANAAVQAFGKQFIGDANSGQVGYLDATIYTEFGDPFYMELVAPPIHGDGKNVFMPQFELDIETGVGLRTGQGSDPQVMLSYSDDSGYSWSDGELWQSLGATGNGLATVQWNKLGSFFERTMRIRISDPVKRVVLGARTPNLSIGAF